tara:strand:+ start:367 stop:663 length:297 start_codon:yes stop_codon:yes gene_type:complete
MWTQEAIKELLKTNDKAVARGVVAIYNLQTESEKIIGETSEANGVGFNGVDANFMSSIAQFYMQKNWLSPKQIEFARKKLLKYSKQLTNIANSNLQEV